MWSAPPQYERLPPKIEQFKNFLRQSTFYFFTLNAIFFSGQLNNLFQVHQQVVQQLRQDREVTKIGMLKWLSVRFNRTSKWRKSNQIQTKRLLSLFGTNELMDPCWIRRRKANGLGHRFDLVVFTTTKSTIVRPAGLLMEWLWMYWWIFWFFCFCFEIGGYLSWIFECFFSFFGFACWCLLSWVHCVFLFNVVTTCMSEKVRFGFWLLIGK